MLRNPAGLVYGTIIVAAVLDAESAAHETYSETLDGIIVAIILAYLAHAFADFAGHRLKERETLQARELAQAMLGGLTVVLGAVVPILVLVLSWAAGARLRTAVNVGIYTAAGMLLVIELVSGLRAQLAGIPLLVQTLFGAAMGALVITLKLVFH